jgi:uncharacterized iron-regulated membrane protein
MVNTKDQIGIWVGALIRGLAITGLMFFTLAIQNGICMENLETGFIAGGLYMFTELAKYYNINLKRKEREYHFLVFP